MDITDQLQEASIELTAALDAADDAKRHRDTLVLQAHREGLTKVQIAVAAGLSHHRIRQILDLERAKALGSSGGGR